MNTLMTKMVRTHAGPVKITCLQLYQQYGGDVEYRAEYVTTDGGRLYAAKRVNTFGFVGNDSIYKEVEKYLLAKLALVAFQERG